MIVVILIIATLTALFVGAAANTFDRARRTQAKNDVTQLVTAINAFYTEYGKYPVPSAVAGDAFYGTATTIPTGCSNAGTNDVLLNILRGIDTTNNPRTIVFLSPGGARNTTPPRGGIVVTGPTAGQYFDPWGSAYAIEIDSGYDNQVTNPYSDTDGSAGTSPVRQGAIAYSYGKNGALGGGAAASSAFTAESGTAGTFKGSSDILSW